MTAVTDRLSERDNGLTPLRHALALLVVFCHAWQIGGYGPDPLFAASGVTLGELGVNGFFALSGYLVTRSFFTSRTVLDYARKRALRILPGLWACLLVVALVVGSGLATPGAAAAWPDALRYVAVNAALKLNQPGIGGAFAGQPTPGLVNGSLWSLLPEALCYVGVALAGLTVLRRRRLGWALAGWVALIAVHALAWRHGAWLEGQGRWWLLGRYATQAAFFAGGACLWLGHAHVVWRGRWIALAWAGLALAAATGWWGGFAPLLLPYALLGLGLAWRAGRLNHWGDVSYGLYLYHFPVMQVLWAYDLRPASAAGLALAALGPTLVLAVASWRAVEAPALRWKPRRAAVVVVPAAP